MVCKTIKKDEGYAEFSWLSQSSNHEGSDSYEEDGLYNIKQSEYVYYNGVKFDNNVAVGSDYGQW